MTRLHGVVVTFERASELARTLDAVCGQTRPPHTLTVVDNSAEGDGVPAGNWPITELVQTFENLGPAGGLAAGVDAVLRHADPDDWVVFIDDDDPPAHPLVLEQLLTFAEDVCRRRPSTAAVGIAGGRFDRRTAALRRLRDEQLVGDVAVDYLGGNQCPMYRTAVLQEVGGPRRDLFFGFEELELGLRLRRNGFELVAQGDAWIDARSCYERLDMTSRGAARSRRRSDWRRYYSTRNLIYIARLHGSLLATLCAGVRYGLVRAVVDATRAQSVHAALPAARGAIDGLRGRMGRMVGPR